MSEETKKYTPLTAADTGVLTEADTEVIDVTADDVIDAVPPTADDIDSGKRAPTAAEYDYVTKFKRAGSVSQQENIVKRFIRQWAEKSGIGAKIKKIQEPLVAEMMSLQANAFDELTNPILSFLNVFLKDNSMSSDQFVVLNNMWSHRTISNKHLTMNSPTDCIIYNADLWKKPLNDIEFITQSYLWLSSIRNITRYASIENIQKFVAGQLVQSNTVVPLEIVNDVLDSLSKTTQKMVKTDDATAVMIRNAIIFDDANEIGTVKSAEAIQHGLELLESIGTDRVRDLDDDVDDMENVSDDDIADILKNGKLDRNNFLKIYKFAKGKGWTR